MNKKPFEGLKLVEFTWGGVGPFVGNFLTYFGATTIRVESKARPDVTRGFQGPGDNPKDGGELERGPVFALTHPTKKYGLCLNMKTPQGVAIFKKLAAWTDVLIESFTTGTMEGWGLGYEDLKKINPKIIMFRSCGYGHTGPMASQPGFGQTVTSLTGFYNITGWPDRLSTPISSFYTDHLAPLGGGLALISAINYMRRTGQGQCIDQAQVETGINFLAPVVLEYTANGRTWPLTGNQNVKGAPHGAYPCKGDDRWVAIGVYSDAEWQAFCNVLKDPEWTKMEKFTTLDGRVKNSIELDKYVGEWTIHFTNEQVMAMLQSAGVAAGVVATAQDSEEDPQLKEYDFFRELDHPYLGKRNFYHPPGFTLSSVPAALHRPTLVGEYNEQICTEWLGIPKAEYEQMMKEGVFS
jgi:benzylsuccinate CoA-transferase BbsF subunit